MTATTTATMPETATDAASKGQTDAYRQSQMMLPFLDAIADAGGRAHTKTLCDGVAERLGVDGDARTARRSCGAAGNINVFDRSVRWAAQRAKAMGYARPIGNGDWEITGKGKAALRNARPGTLVTFFLVGATGIALWGSCQDAVRILDDDSVNLLLTSPPYPLLRKKNYGNVDADAYCDWFLRIAEDWPRKLAKDGSLVINLADVWEKGQPTVSEYQFDLVSRLKRELGLHLCQWGVWHNPSKLPAPAEWVTRTRQRLKPGIETYFWFSPTPFPKADNRKVLRPYSKSMLRRLAAGGEKGATRPSGHALKAGAFSTDNGGSIADNVLIAANTRSNTAYHKACAAAGLPAHPARFPEELPEFFIKFLTDEADLVYDPFGGSGTTAAVAHRLNRRWVMSEMALDYIRGAALRFHGVSGFQECALAA